MISEVFIVGLGQIGGSLARAFRENGVAERIYGYDLRNNHHYRKILDEFVSLSRGIEKADLIVLSTPVREIIKLIRKTGPVLSSDQVVLDTGSSKREIIAEMKNFPRPKFVGGHPMAGTVKREEMAWNPDLFRGKPFFLCYPDESRKEELREVKEVVVKIEALPVEISAEEHDLLAALTSHFPYLISLALFSIYLEKRGQNQKVDDFVSTGFLGATRLVLTPGMMGNDLLLTNRDNLKNLSKLLKSRIDELMLMIEQGSIDSLIDILNAEAEKRRSWYENAGF